MLRTLATSDDPEDLLVQRLAGMEPAPAAALAARAFFGLPPRRHPRPARETAWVAAGGAPLTFAGGKLAATTWGVPGRPAVLLVHGWDGRGTQLGAYAAPLVAHGWRVVALDGPAHGESAGRTVHIQAFAEAEAAVGRELSQTGELAGVVAHSFGASAAFTALHEDGFAPRRMVLCSGPASIRGVLDRFVARLNFGPVATEHFMIAAAREVGVPLDRLDSARCAGAGTTPTLVLHDPADREVPFAEAEKLTTDLGPVATLVPCPGYGHRRILREPAVVARAVRFLVTGNPGAGAVPPPGAGEG